MLQWAARSAAALSREILLDMSGVADGSSASFTTLADDSIIALNDWHAGQRATCAATSRSSISVGSPSAIADSESRHREQSMLFQSLSGIDWFPIFCGFSDDLGRTEHGLVCRTGCFS
jgi:hypothetical protein